MHVFYTVRCHSGIRGFPLSRFWLATTILADKKRCSSAAFQGPPFASLGLGAASGHDRPVHDPTTLRDVCVLPQIKYRPQLGANLGPGPRAGPRGRAWGSKSAALYNNLGLV